MGFGLGCLLGIPLGLATGLSNPARSVADPLIELYRPVPPLAFIPLMILWFGIGDASKVVLLFRAAFSIMVIAARAGVSSVRISKVHAAYALGASRFQILRHVILPNALPEIFTGMRVAMGVCWGTVVAAELIAGAGFVIMTSYKFFQTDIMILGIAVIGIVGYGIDILMRFLERRLVPWKGKG
ncbi:MAG: ABC transporter permease subunit [Geminicoccaceae bacterium]|nr:ABC transporter permease subunit [Geminicoccaceae bacterium]